MNTLLTILIPIAFGFLSLDPLLDQAISQDTDPPTLQLIKSKLSALEDSPIDEKEKSALILSLMENNPKELTKEKNRTKEKIKDITKEIDLFETNKSYIVSYKKNNPLLEQINQKIEKLELEKNNLEKKIKILNKV